MKNSMEERFLTFINKKENGCWEWNRYLDKDGYGQFKPNKKSNPKRAHRFSYELYVGKIPKGLFVCHKCDNPSCVNPEHLFIGTNKDNVRDMILKNRKPRVVNKKQYFEIKKLHTKYKYSDTVLSKLFNVSRGTIYNVLKDIYNYRNLASWQE